jgi:hypothetical protein
LIVTVKFVYPDRQFWKAGQWKKPKKKIVVAPPVLQEVDLVVKIEVAIETIVQVIVVAETVTIAPVTVVAKIDIKRQ